MTAGVLTCRAVVMLRAWARCPRVQNGEDRSCSCGLVVVCMTRPVLCARNAANPARTKPPAR